MSAADLASDAAVAEARAALDAHAVETVAWHFHESTGCPFWLEKKSELKFDPLTEVKDFDDLKKFPEFEDEWLRGGPVAAVGPQGPRREAGLRLRDRRHHGRAEEPDRDRRLPHRLLALQRHAPRSVFPAGRQLADARPERPAGGCAWLWSTSPSTARGSASASTSTRGGSSSASRRLDRSGERVQEALHRPGDHDPHRRARREVHVRHAQADRGSLPGARRSRHEPRRVRRSPASSRAEPSSRRSGRSSASRSCSAARPRRAAST